MALEGRRRDLYRGCIRFISDCLAAVPGIMNPTELIEQNEIRFYDSLYADIRRQYPDLVVTEAEIEELARPVLEGGENFAYYERYRYLFDRLGDVNGRRILELCCGNGYLAVYLARRGAFVAGVDISMAAVEHAHARVAANGCGGRLVFLRNSAYELAFADDIFDFVISNSAHHLRDWSRLGEEVHRVLKPGGRAIFVEPFGHNCFFQFVRRHPFYHTLASPDERGHGVRLEDVARFGRPFRRRRVEGRHLLFTAKRVIRRRGLLRALDRADRWLLRRLPRLERWASVAVIEAFK
jgi:SAM-dependent methyltransferase